jgi:hypothetical protein
LARILRQTQSKDLLLFTAAARYGAGWEKKKQILRFAQDDNSLKVQSVALSLYFDMA